VTQNLRVQQPARRASSKTNRVLELAQHNKRMELSERVQLRQKENHGPKLELAKRVCDKPKIRDR
jgi:hypothetical protein